MFRDVNELDYDEDETETTKLILTNRNIDHCACCKMGISEMYKESNPKYVHHDNIWSWANQRLSCKCTRLATQWVRFLSLALCGVNSNNSRSMWASHINTGFLSTIIWAELNIPIVGITCYTSQKYLSVQIFLNSNSWNDVCFYEVFIITIFS